MRAGDADVYNRLSVLLANSGVDTFARCGFGISRLIAKSLTQVQPHCLCKLSTGHDRGLYRFAGTSVELAWALLWLFTVVGVHCVGGSIFFAVLSLRFVLPAVHPPLVGGTCFLWGTSSEAAPSASANSSVLRLQIQREDCCAVGVGQWAA